MAGFTISLHHGASRTVGLHKRLTSVGRTSDNDVVLDDPAVPDTALAVRFDGTSHMAQRELDGALGEAQVLKDGDVLTVGPYTLTFFEKDAPAADDQASTQELAGVPGRELAALKRLTSFSEQLLASTERDVLLRRLVDECIEVTRADKGFLILVEADEPRITVARAVNRQDIPDAVDRVSESIVRRVVKDGRPLIIADALEHPEFGTKASVVSHKFLSVLCAPLTQKGQLFGVIYLGNDRLVNRFDQKALDLLTIFASQASLLLQNALLVDGLKVENSTLKSQLEEQAYGDIVGAGPAMREVYKRIDRIAPTDITVLVVGETGTGKELIAREIHRRSQRAKGPFISINCGAIPENLLESELFGHVKGAFTGAVATRSGRFQAAIGGTLFLDELGEMPLQLQVKLLRALQEKVVTKVGDSRPESVDIRVVAATNRNLEDEVKRGTFREDLYFRINVVTLRLPPLKDRGDDLVVLARYFLNRHAKEFSSRARGFTPAAVVAMKKYHWPGNIRELENRLKKAVVLADKPLLGPDDLDLRPENLPPILPLAQAKEEFQTRYINEVLERNGGNRTKTAKDLGVDPRTIFRHLERQEGKTMAPETELDEA